MTHGSYFFITVRAAVSAWSRCVLTSMMQVINGLFGAMCFMLFGADTEPNGEALCVVPSWVAVVCLTLLAVASWVVLCVWQS